MWESLLSLGCIPKPCSTYITMQLMCKVNLCKAGEERSCVEAVLWLSSGRPGTDSLSRLRFTFRKSPGNNNHPLAHKVIRSRTAADNILGAQSETPKSLQEARTMVNRRQISRFSWHLKISDLIWAADTCRRSSDLS